MLSPSRQSGSESRADLRRTQPPETLREFCNVAAGDSDRLWRVLFVFLVASLIAGLSEIANAQDERGRIEFFESRIRPVLIEHCYRCHSASAKELEGGLRLDLKAGWQRGGESGQPAVVPGRPEESPLLRSIRHEDGISEMPPGQARLPARAIADLTEWIQQGAIDPRDGTLEKGDSASIWEDEFQRRLQWWSLQPVTSVQVPEVGDSDWPRNDVDRFVLAKLKAASLTAVVEAKRSTLVRRLSFALTGLPPTREIVERFSHDDSDDAYDQLVTTLLDSPHFGERWARHWMDVVHYSDTHGYEWDVPAKNAWRYRDYLTRAFNDDVPYRRMILEQIAGDFLEPRISAETGLNESLIGPMMLRLGERRHGDSAAAEGVTQEAVANMIDTLGKAFLGTTLACSQCHDHKLDAVEQRDYYALAGVLMSTRFSARTIDAVDPNTAVIDELRAIKQSLCDELARQWAAATAGDAADGVVAKLRAIPADEKPAGGFPASLFAFWQRSLNAPVTVDEFDTERQRRVDANQANLKLLADFSSEETSNGWQWDGLGMRSGLVRNGEVVVTDKGDAVLQQVLPAGRFSHVWSQRLAGSLQSPEFDPTTPVTFSVEHVGGHFAAQSFIIDRALHSERLAFVNQSSLGWGTFTAGNFSTLEGTPDKTKRHVYLEFATKALNNYFPPRVNYGGLSETEIQDAKSWIGVTKVWQHSPGKGPQDELERFVSLFDGEAITGDWAVRLAGLLRGAVERWASDDCSEEDVRLLNDALQSNLLPNDVATSATIERLVGEYRTAEKRLQPDRTAGSVADWNEGRNERVGLRGSYTDVGDEVMRGAPRFLGGAAERQQAASSGRLELARTIADPRNPLTARVYVNRVWHYLFGAGLVRTPDDFGHLGERPTHPELLDYLAARFVEDGWSTKKLIRLLVTSATWRQGSVANAAGFAADPENRLWHHHPLRRLEAEAIRDAILAVSGRLDSELFGPPIEPHRTAEDSMKRLFKGPLDGNGRRSIYLEMTLMEPPRFLALFNQPIPKLTTGKRDVTNVPDQALALLNDPFVVAMAEHWSRQLVTRTGDTVEQRAALMLEAGLARKPTDAETARLVQLVKQSAALRDTGEASLLDCQPAWQDAAHAIFNLKEFVHVP